MFIEYTILNFLSTTNTFYEINTNLIFNISAISGGGRSSTQLLLLPELAVTDFINLQLR